MFNRGLGSILLALYLFLFCPVYGGCPTSDLTGDCEVDLEDLGVLADQWLTVYDSYDFAVMSTEWLLKGGAIPDITWVSIAETGFAGQMSRYETTNIQYCQFLNAAMASGDIMVNGSKVYGANGSNGGIDYAGSAYYNLAGAYSSLAARIHYTDGVFSVDSGFENHPVNFVSRYGASAFCGYYDWRLPTLAEWQAVADFDGSYIYGCGTTINSTMANYYSSVGTTSAVGAYAAYGYGMCDMAGNVWEWTCTDYLNNSYICGGGWNMAASSCKISYLLYLARDAMAHNTGFRVCR